jgi:hypothetical protein
LSSVTIVGVETMLVSASPRRAEMMAAQLVPPSRMWPSPSVRPSAIRLGLGESPDDAVPSWTMPPVVLLKFVRPTARSLSDR